MILFSPYLAAVPGTRPTNLTFEEILTRFYLPDNPLIGKGSIEVLRYQVRRWASVMSDLPADQVNLETLSHFRDRCIAKRLSGSNNNNILTTLMRLMHAVGLSVDVQTIRTAWHSPAEKLTLDELRRVWTIADAAKWPSTKAKDYRAIRTDVIPGFWWRAVLMLAYSTGLRRTDLFNLRWDQVEKLCIRTEHAKGARPKLLPITEPLRPWLQVLRTNQKPTVLSRADCNSFDQELARLRQLSGVESLNLQSIRYLSVNEWEQAGNGCGSLILNHKRGVRASDLNYRKLDNASHSLAYPSELLLLPPNLDPGTIGIDSTGQAGNKTDVNDAALQAAESTCSLDLFKSFFSSTDGVTDGLASMTLRQVFETSLRELLETDGRAKATIQGYRKGLNHWERLTDNPPIGKISTERLQQFRKAAKSETNFTPASCNSWFRSLRAILNHLGPRNNSSRRSRSALSFYSEVPWLDDLPTQTLDPSHLDEDQINRIYEHCRVAEWPPKSRTGCEPCDWWRCAIVIMVNYGPRRNDWYHLRSQAISFEKGICTFTAQKTGKKHVLVLNDTVTWHLKKLGVNEREFVFTPSQTKIQLYREWHRIQSDAGVSAANGLPFEFQEVRATAAARYHEHFPGTAELLLGHGLKRENKVTYEHYLGNAKLKPLWHAIRHIPQPSSFIASMKAVGADQF